VVFGSLILGVYIWFGECLMSQPESGPENPGPGEIWITTETIIS
jgi:hypothetical protein